MMDDYERPSFRVNGHDISSSWILTDVLFFGLFVISPREDRFCRRTADGAGGGWALLRRARRAERVADQPGEITLCISNNPIYQGILASTYKL